MKKSTRKKEFVMRKSFSGKITYDRLTKIHEYLIKLLKMSKFPADFALPIAVGSKKVKNYVFARKKFFKKLKCLVDNDK